MMSRSKSLLFSLLCCCVVFLTGCVRYDVGITVKGQHQGYIEQTIKLGEQFTRLSQSSAKKWIHSIEQRTEKLQGNVKHISSQEIKVKIPFNNGQELSEKFNQFFNPNDQQILPELEGNEADNSQIASHLSLTQSNWLLVERNKLVLDVDLRALGLISDQGNIIVSPGSLLNLDFALTTPWGGKAVLGENYLLPRIEKNGQRFIWQLQAGQMNHLETIFWVPSSLGLGTFLIILLVAGGVFVKSKLNY